MSIEAVLPFVVPASAGLSRPPEGGTTNPDEDRLKAELPTKHQRHKASIRFLIGISTK
jgi:hypothetical protein